MLTVTAMAKKSDKRQASALDEVRRHVRVFVDLGRVAGESNDQNHFLDQVVVQVARAVEIDHVKVLGYRRREADLLVAAGFGWKEGVVRSATLSADLRSPPGRSFQTAQPVVIKNFQAQDDFIHSGLLQEHGIISLVNVPVLIEGAAWGVLEVDSTRPRDFSQDTIEFLTATAALIGAFLQSHGGEPSEAARLATAAMQAQNRDVLLREMQHRVKNNFQIILASIAIQKRRYSAGDAQRALDHIASRINAISLAHDQLAPREEGQIVKLSDYLRALCHSIKQQAEGIEVEVQADELELSIDRAVWRQAGRFEGRSAVATWLLSIARFKALSTRRRQTHAELDETIEATVADPTDDPEVMLEKKNRDELVREALTKLSPEHREIIDLVYYHEKSVEECAQILAISAATVKTRMFYARKKLAELVERA
jgi:RNA polymerase sigma factor (sigma-70 family)